MITFDPNGGNLHPDHIAISRFTSDAVTAAADGRWHPELGPPHRVVRLLWVGTVLPWEETDPGRLAETPGVDFLLHGGRLCYAASVVTKNFWRETMKKSLKKLVLSKETLRTLESRELSNPQGGTVMTTWPICPTNTCSGAGWTCQDLCTQNAE